jgi:hypothetical protein
LRDSISSGTQDLDVHQIGSDRLLLIRVNRSAGGARFDPRQIAFLAILLGR